MLLFRELAHTLCLQSRCNHHHHHSHHSFIMHKAASTYCYQYAYENLRKRKNA